MPDGRDRRWDDHRQARREHLLETAVGLIDAEGVGVGVAAMASAAGIPRSVVYKLFGDRGDLDEQIRQRVVGSVSAQLWTSLEATDSIRALVRRGVQTYVHWVAEHPNLHRFLGAGSTTAPTRESPASRGGKQSFASRTSSLIELAWGQFVADADPPRGVAENLAHAAVGLVDNTVNHWLAADGASTSTDDLVAFLTDALCGVIEAGGRAAGIEVEVDAVIELMSEPG